ncbi:hypothetical protein LOK74_17430 [Brevibacillus humidisoli]|uniref:hypothetical protein n=1 Tax=Brevibacillus humidisoli TaxID=2895522 RepID=UPI001E4BA02A|nr:hypothetical protein [Brevibacillus humidisoli]UFJ39816.1 hypothetical protein LOK74_17430 [Brevibacillus humidisoli]
MFTTPRKRPQTALPEKRQTAATRHIHDQPSAGNPIQLTATDLFALHRLYGNRAVAQWMTGFPKSQPIQRYSESEADPAQQVEAVRARKQDRSPRAQFNVATAHLKTRSDSLASSTRTSPGANNADLHAERLAIETSMSTLGIGGYDQKNGQLTGRALQQNGIDNVDVYTEFPPCSKCGPYLREMDGELAGEVSVTFSTYLADWYNRSKSQRQKMWDNHLEAIQDVDIDEQQSSSDQMELSEDQSEEGSVAVSAIDDPVDNIVELNETNTPKIQLMIDKMFVLTGVSPAVVPQQTQTVVRWQKGTGLGIEKVIYNFKHYWDQY